MIGKRLAHFEITAKLGEGGMGEVYRATDIKLGRDVAIKVLPEGFAGDADRLARFDREARVLASLNHPSIASIHALEKDESIHFLVMELAEGEDLNKRLTRDSIPTDRALAIALKIAQGLEYAHNRGVVHRDLKPANVMLGPDDEVKILDFGLAKALEAPGSDAGVDVSVSPTMTAKMTQAGVLLGTAAYMSPEQARGNEVDKRADIWAFGVVLFEMLVGKRLFDGPSLTDILAAVMREDIDLDKLPANVPGSIRRLLARCVDRDEKNRLRDIGEARIGIAAVLSGDLEAFEDSTETGSAAPTTKFKRFLPLVAGALGIAIGIVFGSLYLASPDEERKTEVVHTSIRLPEGVRLAGWSSPAVAISPDERTIAFVGQQEGKQQLYLRRLDEAEAVVVPGSDGAEGPFFSPDSRWVAFGAGAISGRSTEPKLLKRAPVDGGSTQDVAPLLDYVGGSWGTDGYIYFGESFVKGWLRRVIETGGEPEPLFADDRAEPLSNIAAAWPQYINNGRKLLFTSLRTERHQAVMLDLETGEIQDLDQPSSFTRFSPSGYMQFVGNDGVLKAAPLDLQSARKRTAPASLVSDVAFTCNEAAVFAIGGSGMAIYAKGFVRGSDRVLSRLVRIDPADGSIERLPFEPDAFLRGNSLSPDGRQLIVATWDGSLWIYDLNRGTRLRMPDGGIMGHRTNPVWSPDGKMIAYTVNDSDNNGAHVYVQAADGTGKARLVHGVFGESYASGWTPDSRSLILDQFSDVEGVFRVTVGKDEPPRPQQLPIQGGNAVVSPDGHWIAYQSRETGRREIYLQPFPEGGAVIPVSSNGGTRPEWPATGNQLYFSNDCQYFAVDVTPGPDLRLGNTRRLVEHCDPSERRGAAFTVDREGRFYLLEAVRESGIVESLELVQNWDQLVSEAFGQSRSDD
jgi:serine/threonine-protein kinase